MQDGVNIAPFYYENEQEGLLALVNTGLDEEKVTIETTYKLKEKGDTVDNIFTVRPLEFRLLTVCKYEESL